MTSANLLRVHCAALGFLAVLLHDEVKDKQAIRAKAVAKLIESFCYVTVPEAFRDHNDADENYDTYGVERKIDDFKAELVAKGDARLPQDRLGLLQFYDRLQQRSVRRKERNFYASGEDDMIANRILSMIDKETEQDMAEDPGD